MTNRTTNQHSNKLYVGLIVVAVFALGGFAERIIAPSVAEAFSSQVNFSNIHSGGNFRVDRFTDGNNTCYVVTSARAYGVDDTIYTPSANPSVSCVNGGQ